MRTDSDQIACDHANLALLYQLITHACIGTLVLVERWLANSARVCVVSRHSLSCHARLSVIHVQSSELRNFSFRLSVRD